MTHSSEPSIAVLFHSGYGHTAAVAQHVANGAGAGARLVTIDAEGNLTDEDWHEVQAGVTVKLVPSPEGDETFILARSEDRQKKSGRCTIVSSSGWRPG